MALSWSRAAVAAPAASTVPDSLSATLASGDSTSRPLALHNTGADRLTFTLAGPRGPSSPTPALRLASPPFPDVADPIFTTNDPVASRKVRAPSRARATATSTLAPAGGVALGTALVIGDGGTESDVGPALASAGYQVTIVGDDSGWNGTNPAPQSFNLVVLLDGVGFGSDMPLGGQTTLLNYVEHGGGLIVTEWSSWEVAQGRYQSMLPLIPVTRTSGGTGVFTNVVVASHPVTNGVAASFHVSCGTGHGVLTSGTAVVELPGGEPAVVVKQQAQGRIVYFAHAGNYFSFRPFTDPNVRQLLLNAADWVRGSVWLSASPTSGFVDPGQSVTLAVGLSARSLPVGVYTESLRIATNDPLRSELDVPVRLAVGLAPVIGLQPAALDFGSKPLTVADTLVLRVQNLGSDVLNVSDVSSGSAAFEVLGARNFSLAPSQSNDVSIRMGRASLGSFNSTINVTSNDPTRPVAQASVTGSAVQPPVLTVSPGSVDLTAASGATTSAPVTVGNTGPGSLSYSFVGPHAAWLTVAPASGAVAPGGQQPVTVGASATALFAGTFLDTLVLTTNDPVPARARVTIPVRFVVSGHPTIATAPDTVRFLPAWVGVSTHQSLTIYNTGTANLHLGAFSFSNPKFHLGAASPVLVPPAQQATADLVCDSNAPGTETGSVTFTSDDASRPSVSVRVEATLQQPGLARVQPPSLGLTLDQDASANLSLTLFNDGTGPLGYSFTSVPAWITFTPSAGTVSPSGSAPIAVHVSATGLPPGTTNGSVVLSTTDPRATTIPIPVTLQVDGLPPAPPVADAPIDGQINVSVRGQLRWFASPRALRYDLYLWRAIDAVPSSPLAAGLVGTSYTLSPPLVPGTAYRWKVVSIDATGATSGPVLSFTTEQLPDLAVTLVEAPPTAFSGQPVSVHYVITNQGLNGTNAPIWTDQVYLSPTSTFDPLTAVPEGAPQNPAFLAPGESYSVNMTFTLPRDAIGPYRLFVRADQQGAVTESDETNNLSAPSPTMQVLLTPPPNLIVAPAVIAPVIGFSGQPTNLGWTVQNKGTGATRESDWTDAVYLSADTVLSIGTDVLLGTAGHSGALAPGGSYSRSLTVNLPNAISGGKFFLFVADAGNAIYESVFEGDNVRPSAVDVHLTPPPDFTAGDVSAAASVQSGQPLHVHWRVTNAGAGQPFENSWFDGVYLCPTATFDASTSLLLGNVQHFAPLTSGSSYTDDEDFTLPIDLSGNFYVFVSTDVGNGVFEGGADGNNQARSATTTRVDLTPPPNLVPAQVTAPATARGGDPIAVSWTVENRGAGATASGSWVDRVSLVSGTTWNPSQVLTRADVSHSGSLAVGGAYTSSTSLTPPVPFTGVATVFVDVDLGGNVFEGTNEGDNRGSSASVNVLSALPSDLGASWQASPAQAVPGASLALAWTVQNHGPHATLASDWNDEVYLSTDAVFDPAIDVPLAVIGHSGTLAVGASYGRGANVVVPDLAAGSYFLILVNDREGSVIDSQRANNTVATPITLLPRPPSADLRVTQLLAPASVMAGQPITVNWTVQNQGAGPTAHSSWYDAIYLSSDPIVDNGDARIASLQHTGALATGGSYSTSLGVDIPSYFSGNYYLIVACDSRNDEDERSAEGNNSASAVIGVQVPPPCDLVVTNVDAPATAVPGQLVTVSWTLANTGANRVTGTLRDGVYVSGDVAWDVGDPVVGLLDHTIDLAPGAQAKMSALVDVGRPLQADATGDVIAPLPGLTPGQYHFIVRTDLRNVIHESDDTNNLGVAGAPTDVDVAGMSLGTPVSVGLSSSQQKYFRLDVGAGLDLRLDLAGGTSNGWGEIYVAFGRVPSLSDFDVSAALPFSASERALVPTTQAGSYYVMLVGRGTGVSNGSLVAQALSFQILEGTPTAGGQGGRVTCHYLGAGFQPGIQAQLRDGTGATFPAASVTRVNSSECVVVWDLADRDTGTCAVVLTNPAGLPAGGAATFKVVAPRQMNISVSRNAPTSIRAGSTVVVTAQCENTGNVDIPFAFVTVEVLAGQDLRVVSDRFIPLSRFFNSANTSAPQFYESGGMRYFPLMARDLAVGEIGRLTVSAPSGRTGRVSMVVRAQALGTTAFALAAVTNVEQLRQSILANPANFDPSLVLQAGSVRGFRTNILNPLYTQGLIDPRVGNAVVDNPKANGAKPGGSSSNGCHEAVTWIGCGVEILACVADAFLSEIDPFLILSCAIGLTTGCILEPFAPPPQGVDSVLLGAQALDVSTELNAVDIANSGLDLTHLAVDATLTAVDNYICPLVIRSSDPNDIQGPSGVGPERWVAKSASMPYVIHFENDSTHANGPARAVEIRQPLDPRLDPRTFRLGHIGLGAVTIDVPDNHAFTSQRVDLRDSLGVFVDVNAGVDVVTHEAFWVLRAIDPATGQAPENPLLGLLPVNDTTGHGEGFVSYTISPVATIATGDTARAKATIVFDSNDPIDTPEFQNLFDGGPPSTHVNVMPDGVPPGPFVVTWSGADDARGSGLAAFDVYMKRGTAPDSLWLSHTTDTSGVFVAVPGGIYSFYSVGIDRVGQREAVPATPDITVSTLGQGTDAPPRTAVLALYGMWPNPARGTPTVAFSLPNNGPALLELFDIAGRRVVARPVGSLGPGPHVVRLADGHNVSPGIYVIRLTAAGRRLKTKSVVIQ